MRLVQRKIASYQEVRTFWDINDVMRANEHLDIQDDAEWLASEEARAKARRQTGHRR